MELHEQVRARRRELRLTQADLAQRMGVSIGTVKRIERPGARPPSLSTMKSLEEALGWTAEEETTDVAPTLFPTEDGPPTGSMAYRWAHLAAVAFGLPEAELSPLVHLVEAYLEVYRPE